MQGQLQPPLCRFPTRALNRATTGLLPRWLSAWLLPRLLPAGLLCSCGRLELPLRGDWPGTFPGHDQPNSCAAGAHWISLSRGEEPGSFPGDHQPGSLPGCDQPGSCSRGRLELPHRRGWPFRRTLRRCSWLMNQDGKSRNQIQQRTILSLKHNYWSWTKSFNDS